MKPELAAVFPVPEDLSPLDEAIVEEISEVAGIYFRSVLLKRANTVMPQHTHSYDHATYVGSGAVRLWVDGSFVGTYEAGTAIEVKANKKHLFQSILPRTRLVCVHDTKSAGLIKEMEGHHE